MQTSRYVQNWVAEGNKRPKFEFCRELCLSIHGNVTYKSSFGKPKTLKTSLDDSNSIHEIFKPLNFHQFSNGATNASFKKIIKAALSSKDWNKYEHLVVGR